LRHICPCRILRGPLSVISVATSENIQRRAVPPEPERLARGPVGVGGLVSRLTKPVLGHRGFAGTDIINHWATIVGPELAVLACPLSLKFDRQRRDGATLMIRVASSAAATLLQFKAPQVIERINRYCGYQAVAKLQVALGALPKIQKQLPPEPPPLDETERAKVEATVAPITSEAVRSALGRLGQTLRRRALARTE